MAEEEQQPPVPAPGARRHPKGLIVDACLALAVVLGVLAVLSVWINRQVLNTDNWTNTSGKLLANPKIQATVGDVLVNTLFTSVNVEQQLKDVLPPALEGLAGPAAAGLRESALQLAPEFLATPAVQHAWRLANRTAQLELLKILNGGSGVLSTGNGEVVLHLHPLVTQLAAQLGLQSQLQKAREKLSSSSGKRGTAVAEATVGVKIPPGGNIVLLRARQLRTAQDIVKAIKGLSAVLPVLAVALLALAVALARGWRRIALRRAGWCMAAVGLLAILSRHLIGEMIVNSLVKSPANRPAVLDGFEISTTLLYDIAVATTTYGLAVVLAAWIAGDTRPARMLRRALAPTLRERPLSTYALAALALLLLVLWGPFPSTRQALPVAGIAILLAVGIDQLRRATAREFPGALASDTGPAVRALMRRSPKDGAASAAG